MFRHVVTAVRHLSHGKRAIGIALESPSQPDVLTLFKASDKYHEALYPAESNHLLDPSTLEADNVRFMVARLDGVVAGCGAVVMGSDGSAEMKRMWVDPTARGTGLGRHLLDELESQAKREGASVVRLETGISQPEAIALYESSGFQQCDPFGEYVEDPLSIFMEKNLS